MKITKFIIALVYTSVFVWFAGGWLACAAAVISFGVSAAWLIRVSGRLEGVNGDVYGACSELTETVYIVMYIVCAGTARLML